MKKAVLYFGCLAVIFGVLAAMVFMEKAPGKELSLFDTAVALFEENQEISANEVTWETIRYLPPEYHEKEYNNPFEQDDDMTKIEGKEDMLSEFARLLDGVVIYDKEQEERVNLYDRFATVEISGQYKRKIGENIFKTEGMSITLDVNKERTMVTIKASGSHLGTSRVTYMLKTDNK